MAQHLTQWDQGKPRWRDTGGTLALSGYPGVPRTESGTGVHRTGGTHGTGGGAAGGGAAGGGDRAAAAGGTGRGTPAGAPAGPHALPSPETQNAPAEAGAFSCGGASGILFETGSADQLAFANLISTDIQANIFRDSNPESSGDEFLLPAQRVFNQNWAKPLTTTLARISS